MIVVLPGIIKNVHSSLKLSPNCDSEQTDHLLLDGWDYESALCITACCYYANWKKIAKEDFDLVDCWDALERAMKYWVIIYC